MIVAMQNFIPDRRAVSAVKKAAPAPAPNREQDQQEDSPAVPACPAGPAGPGVPWSVPWKPKHAPGSAREAPPDPGPSRSTFANRFTPSEAPKPYVPLFGSVPDLGVPFSIKNPFVHPR
jgi:hypothetical protein